MELIKRKISNDDILNMPVKTFDGEIIIVDNEKTSDNIFKSLEDTDIIGFDTETRPSFKKGERHQVALLQLATHEKTFLIRVDKIGIPDTVLKILENENIKKSGVAIHDDIKALQAVRDFKPAGFIELQSFVESFDIQDKGLKKLSCSILGFRISKSARLSNWENDEYTQEQKQYAATDAWVSFLIYRKLISLNGDFKIID
jgi:ribonuclease D